MTGYSGRSSSEQIKKALSGPMAFRHPPPETWINYSIISYTNCVNGKFEDFLQIFHLAEAERDNISRLMKITNIIRA